MAVLFAGGFIDARTFASHVYSHSVKQTLGTIAIAGAQLADELAIIDQTAAATSDGTLLGMTQRLAELARAIPPPTGEDKSKVQSRIALAHEGADERTRTEGLYVDFLMQGLNSLATRSPVDVPRELAQTEIDGARQAFDFATLGKRVATAESLKLLSNVVVSEAEVEASLNFLRTELFHERAETAE